MKNKWPGFALIIILFSIWELVTVLKIVNTPSFPSVHLIVTSWVETLLNGVLLKELFPSLYRIFWGFFWAVIVAVPLGLLMGTVPLIYRLFEPITEFTRPIPASAYIPIAILFLGIGNEMKVFVVFISCVFPILLNTYGGVRAVDQVLIDTGRTFGASRLRSLWQIILPASLPSILTGMRISVGLSLIVVVVSEMVAGNSGIGYFILNMQRVFRIPEMYAGIITIGLLGYLLNFIFLKAESKILRWK